MQPFNPQKNEQDKLDQAIDKVHDALDDLVDPSGQQRRTREAVSRHNAGLLPTVKPAVLSPEEQAAEDDAVEQKRKQLAAESQSYDRQEGESVEDWQARVERLRERELRNKMTGSEVMHYDQLKAKERRESDLKARLDSEPYCRGTIVEVTSPRATIEFDTTHPYAPNKHGRIFLTVPSGEVGMTGQLIHFNNGLPVWQYRFELDSGVV